MCTVTFFPWGNGVFITSNRDEHNSRGIAKNPEMYQFNAKKLTFPKDAKAGGTWFISNELGDTGVLLNGAFDKHVSLAQYRMSRGLILIEIFQSDSPFEALMKLNLDGIENFTIILWENRLLREIKWDGIKLFVRNHDPQKAHIWSSVTLYSSHMIMERHKWFSDWLISKKKISQQKILEFHSSAGLGNQEYGLRISRDNNISTSSITSLSIKNQRARYYHIDFIQNIESAFEYELLQFSDLMTPLIKISEVTKQD